MAGFDAYQPRLERVEADIAELKRDVAELKRDNLLLKWMAGFILLFQVTIFIKLFLH